MSLQIRASSTLKNAFKSSSTPTWSRTAWLSTTSTASGSSEAENSSSSASTAATPKFTTAPPLPYTVKRSSASTAYCVYHDYRAQAGHLTLIKAGGDLHALARDMTTDLFPSISSPKPDTTLRRPKKLKHFVSVLPEKEQIVLRGRWKREIVSWLDSKGI
ncbi:hypothetical protein FRC04_006211 [Tulasnella sp. 424]|nr:hypothetical protein FRC04_006211 [Tulasnella sp. 424]KAG8981860.1 hypothetical protein FRC05_000002 [Tulasnella sp. 425]